MRRPDAQRANHDAESELLWTRHYQRTSARRHNTTHLYHVMYRLTSSVPIYSRSDVNTGLLLCPYEGTCYGFDLRWSDKTSGPQVGHSVRCGRCIRQLADNHNQNLAKNNTQTKGNNCMKYLFKGLLTPVWKWSKSAYLQYKSIYNSCVLRTNKYRILVYTES